MPIWIALLPPIVASIAVWLWSLSLLFSRDRWAMFLLCLPLGWAAGWWLLWQERPGLGESPRFLLDGAIVAATLFFPLWVSGAAFVLLLGVEMLNAMREDKGPEAGEEAKEPEGE